MENLLKVEKITKKFGNFFANNEIDFEKDLVKLPNSFLAEFEIYVIVINVKLEEETNIIKLLYPLLENN